MGSYTETSVAGYPLLQSKSFVIPEAMTIFRETDKRIFVRKLSERNPLIWGNLKHRKTTETAIQYVSTAGKIIDRLNVMGFTLDRVHKEFDSFRLSRIEELASWDDEAGIFTDQREFLEGLSFASYTDGLRHVIESGLLPYRDRKKKRISPVVKYILDENEDYDLGFFGSDVRSLLRLGGHVVDIDSEVVQDITEVVSAGYYQQDEPVCSNAVRALTSAYPENSIRIVLAEGSTDIEIIRESLALLYPHLSEYYSFFDFDASRSQGGAGHLVSIVKAFAAAGVANRVIALFDNDTAAREARRALDAISMPPNIAVLAYPPLEKLRSYPTIGPTGLTLLDVNGLAASIELYLGHDVLASNAGPTPIQWRGYSEAVGAYHGEVMHKAHLHVTFLRKVQRCKSGTTTIETSDWSGLDAILKAIFTAFD
jgi:HEPN/Toprim N-terminal domain 1